MSIRDRIVELRRVKASDLKPDPRNPRTHPDPQRKALHAMLSEIGFADAVLARETPDGLVIVDGHLRAEIGNEEIVPVLVLDVDEDEARDLLLTLDPLAAMAVSDAAALAQLIAEADLAREVLEAEPWSYVRRSSTSIGADHESVSALPRESRFSTGEIWSLDVHRLACGDARDAQLLASLMDGSKGDVLLTDPPYGVSYVGKTPERLEIANDDRTDLSLLLREAFSRVDGHLKPGARIYLFHPAGPNQRVFQDAFVEAGWSWKQSLTWVKDSIVLGRSDYHYRHEPILYGSKPTKGRVGRGGAGWYGGSGQGSVIEVPRPKASELHPTMKPVALIRTLLRNSAAPAQIVLDPFAGSGSTLLAAHELGLEARLVEISPAYCEAIASRYEQITGQQAERIDVR
jgi:DNA modification methylase